MEGTSTNAAVPDCVQILRIFTNQFPEAKVWGTHFLVIFFSFSFFTLFLLIMLPFGAIKSMFFICLVLNLCSCCLISILQTVNSTK